MSDFMFPWCSKCNDNFPMREKDYNDLEVCGNTFYCPSGHSLVISRRSIVKKFKDADRRVDYYSQRSDRLEKRAGALQGVLTRHHNRLLRGACPYCNKTPSNMTKHICEKHGSKT